MANYGAVIEVSVKGQQALDQLESSARKIQTLIQGIKQQRNIFDQAVGSEKTRELKKNLENLVASFAGAKEGARQFKITAGGTEQTINMYSKTLAGLNSQLSTFRSIANNATVGTDQYRNAVVAANKVSNEFARTQAKAFGVNMKVSGMNVQDVVALGKSIPDTIEGLTFYQDALENVLKTVKIGSNDFRALEEAIAGTGARLSTARLAGQTSGISSAAGPATRLDTVAAFQKRANFAKQAADLEYRQLITGQQIVQAKLKETQQEDLQNRLAQASEALANNELDVAKRLTVELRNQRIAYERKNRAEEALMRPSSMTAGAAESTFGRRPGGLPPVPGSPAAWMATGGIQAPAAKAAEQTLNTQTTLQKRLQNIIGSGLILEQKALEYKAKGLQVDHEINHLETLNNKLKSEGAQLTKAELDQIDVILNGLRNELLLRKAIANTQRAQPPGTKPPAPGGGAGAASKDNRGGALQNALIGGAFPLLFGGGPGAVVGGFAGGFIPGNPMMSIVTSAIGTIVDRVIAGARVAGEAVRTLDTTIQHMSDSALFSSKETEFLAKQYAEAGRSSLALQVVQEELNKKIGYEGVASLQNLGDASSKLNRAWADLNLQLQVALAGPLAGLLQFIADVLKFAPSTASQSNVNTITKNLKPEQAAQFQKEMFASLSGGEAAQKPIIAKYEALAKKQTQTNIKLSNEELTARLQDGEKLYTELAELERTLNDKKRQYAEQYADMVLALQRQQFDLTEQLQRKAFDTQVQALGKELELLKKQGDIRIEIARNASKERELMAAPGADAATTLMNAVDDYRTGLAEINNEAANNERQFKLEMLKFDVENERYKLDVAKTIARTNYDNTVKIARINKDINRENEEISIKNYRRQIAAVSIELAKVRAQLEADTEQTKVQRELVRAQGKLTTDAEKFYNSLIKANDVALARLAPAEAQAAQGQKLLQMPSKIPGMGALPALSADTRGIDAANDSLARQIAAYQELLQTAQQLTDEDRNRLQLLASIEQAFIAPLNQMVKAQNDLIIYQATYNDSILNGTIPALSEQLAKIEQLYDPAVGALNIQIAELEALKAENETLFNQQALLESLIERRDRLRTARGAAIAGATAEQSPEKRLQNAFIGVKGELNTLLDPIQQITTAAEGIGAAFSDSFKGVISGAMTAQEALASFFQSVADRFLDMAAQIIAKWIEMTILNSVLSLFPGGGMDLAGATAAAGKLNPAVGFGVGPIGFRAAGGPVSAGSPYIVGEKGPELFVPGRSGGIVPNNQLGGDTTNVVVNVDASGSKVQGDEPKANELARAVSAAVQAELVKQKRPGGLLA